MSVSGTLLYGKVREIMPGLPSGITPEVLSKSCDDSVSQPFLKWFCSNVGWENVLLPEDVKLEKHIKKKGEWLEGEELDAVLAEATEDCPDLMKLLGIDSAGYAKLSDELEAEKDAYKEDMDYLQTLEESLRNLKEIGTKLDEDIETEESQLEKNRIKVKKIYMDCTSTLEEFDSSHHQFFRDIESLLDIYAEAIEKKSTPVVWTQLPLDIFIKQMEMHNDYLGIYVKRHFGGKVEQGNDSDYDSLIDDGKGADERVHELLNCQRNVIMSKTDEINAKIEESASSATAAHAIQIYNGSDNLIPQSETQIRTEINALTVKRDFLEENIELMRENQLKEVVRQYARFVITKILVDDGHARDDRRQSRLEKLENLRMLVRERGHGHADLLCMLMQLQLRRLKEIYDFVTDGRRYLAAEYRLTSVRSDSMRQQQDKFDEIMKSSPKEQSVFNKILISLILGTESDPNDLSIVTKKYDELMQDNERRKKNILGMELDTRISKLKKLHNEVMAIYDEEVKGRTKSLKPISCDLLNRLDDSTKNVRDVQNGVNEIRAKIKEMSKKTSDDSFERDTVIMWQRFLANHEELQSKYDEAKRKIENSHFSITSDL